MRQTLRPGSGTGDKRGLFPAGFGTLGEFGAEFVLFGGADNQKQQMFAERFFALLVGATARIGGGV